VFVGAWATALVSGRNNECTRALDQNFRMSQTELILIKLVVRGQTSPSRYASLYRPTIAVDGNPLLQNAIDRLPIRR